MLQKPGLRYKGKTGYLDSGAANRGVARPQRRQLPDQRDTSACRAGTGPLRKSPGYCAFDPGYTPGTLLRAKKKRGPKGPRFLKPVNLISFIVSLFDSHLHELLISHSAIARNTGRPTGGRATRCLTTNEDQNKEYG